MSEHSQATINYRCPICFSREVDVRPASHWPTINTTAQNAVLQAAKPTFVKMYRELQKKYRFAQVRLTLKDIEQL